MKQGSEAMMKRRKTKARTTDCSKVWSAIQRIKNPGQRNAVADAFTDFETQNGLHSYEYHGADWPRKTLRRVVNG